MSQALAESHVGVWKRRFASWVRARMDAVKEEDEESKRAMAIKQSWVDLGRACEVRAKCAGVGLI